jgi:hypothetical protein
MFENTVQRRRFGSKMEKVSGGLRKLHTAKLHNLYSSLIILKRKDSVKIRCGGCMLIGKMRHGHNMLVGKPEGKGQAARRRDSSDGRLISKQT